GLNIAEALLRAGEEVIVLGNQDPPSLAIAELGRLPGKLHVVRADVSDRGAVDAAFSQHRPHRLVHAATITAGADRELREFDRIIDVNIKGTANVLRAAVESGVEKFVYVSSGSVYGESLLGRDPLAEERSAPVPDTLYAITKFAGERICARLSGNTGLKVVCVRLGSVFGPWEFDTGVRDTLSLPLQILRRAMRGEEVLIAHNEPRRDWIYSRDVAAGIVGILQAPVVPHGLYNLSSGLAWSGVSAAWCECLRAEFPRLQFRTIADGERANVEFLGSVDRATMRIDRLAADTGFQAAFDQRRAFDDYLAWIRGHAAFLTQ
ncbi:MAG: NAD-dependent epimerase/dehydratase family protein, partial [Betaproteobacteria bacterium]|nr:NAD-dependent epimerase/dehydratase family protein [Betaproteobacteria bacterium]